VRPAARVDFSLAQALSSLSAKYAVPAPVAGAAARKQSRAPKIARSCVLKSKDTSKYSSQDMSCIFGSAAAPWPTLDAPAATASSKRPRADDDDDDDDDDDESDDEPPPPVEKKKKKKKAPASDVVDTAAADASAKKEKKKKKKQKHAAK
jgi:nucleolin